MAAAPAVLAPWRISHTRCRICYAQTEGFAGLLNNQNIGATDNIPPLKITLKAGDFRAAVGRVLPAISKKSLSNSLFEHVLLEVEPNNDSEGHATVMATDGMLALKCPVQVEGVISGGMAAVPGKLLFDLLGQEGATTSLQISANKGGAGLTLKNGRSATIGLRGENAEDFPAMPKVKPAVKMVVQRGVLRDALLRTRIAAAREDESRQNLSSVVLGLSAGQAVLLATDGRLFARLTFAPKARGVENSAQDEQVKAVETKASPEGKTKGAGESGSEEEEAAAAQKGQRAWAVAQLEQSKARRNSKDKKSTNVAAEAKVVQSANVGAKEAEEVDEEAAAQIAARQRKWALSQLGFDGPPKSPTVGKEERERGSEAGGEDECMDEETAAQKAARQRKWAVAQLGFEIKGGEGKKEEKKEVEAERQRKWAMAQLGYQDSRKDGKEGGEGVKVERQKTLSIARQLEEKQSIRTKRVMNDKKREEALQRVARQKALEIVKMLEETAKKNKKREGAGEEERGGGETEEAQTAGGRSALAIAKWLEETSKRGKQKRQNQSPVGGTKSTEKVAERAAYFHAVLSGQKPVELQEEGAVVEEDDGTLNLRKTPKFEPVVESEKREMDGEGREGSTERTVPLEASQEKVENVVVGVGGQPEEETEGEKEEKIERVEYDEKEEHKDEDVAMIELAVEKAVEQMLESGDWQIVDKREVENTHIRSTPTWAVGTGEVGYGKLGKTEGREGEWKVETQEELQKQVEAAILSAERASATKAKSAQGGKLSSSLSGLTFFNPPSPQTFPGISMRKTRTPTSATRSEKGEEGEEDDEDDELNLTEVVQAITQNLTSIFQKWSPYKTTSGSGSTDALPIIDF